MKECLIYQPCGNGDQWFLLKAARYFYDLGYRVTWPVVHEYIWMQQHVPWIHWISWGDTVRKLTHQDTLPDSVQFKNKEKYNPYLPNILSGDFIYINGFAPFSGRVMESKYTSIGQDYRGWHEFVRFDRNSGRERQLLNRLNISNSEKFCFVNRNFQLRPTVLKYENIKIDPSFYNKRVVELSIINGFTSVDWLAVIERADSIHMIETSLNYIMESPQVRHNLTSDLHLYSRCGNFSEVDYLFTLPWNYHR